MIPFGKYRGAPLGILASDPAYVSWLKAQDWLAESSPEVYEYVNRLDIPALRYCAALTRDGDRCKLHAKCGDKCKRHFNRDTADDFTSWESELVSA